MAKFLVRKQVLFSGIVEADTREEALMLAEYGDKDYLDFDDIVYDAEVQEDEV